MFVLLELTFLFYVMFKFSNGVSANLALKEKSGTGQQAVDVMSSVANFIALSLGNFVHFVFVLKYWIVSKKVEH
jgi:hypothetical protein